MGHSKKLVVPQRVDLGLLFVAVDQTIAIIHYCSAIVVQIADMDHGRSKIVLQDKMSAM
jgi:hypothetical protein